MHYSFPGPIVLWWGPPRYSPQNSNFQSIIPRTLRLVCGYPGIALRTADDKPTCRVDQHLRVVVHHRRWDHDVDNLCPNVTFNGIKRDISSVLRRDNDRVDAYRSVVNIFYRNLSLSVRSEVTYISGLPNLSKPQR